MNMNELQRFWTPHASDMNNSSAEVWLTNELILSFFHTTSHSSSHPAGHVDMWAEGSKGQQVIFEFSQIINQPVNVSFSLSDSVAVSVKP